MKCKRYCEEQIFAILMAHDMGTKVADLVHKHGSIDVSEAKHLNMLETENAEP